jgi:HEAT repeat protein
MKTMNKIAAVALTLLASTSANAGKGGSNAAIQDAVASGSRDAIIAEVERAEGLMCSECIQTVTNLTEDNRYEVREVAAWWFGKRPQLAHMMAEQMESDLTNNADSIHVRNAADFLGTIKEYKALPVLRATMQRTNLSVEAKLALVRAAGVMAHKSANPILTTGMVDADASVRAASIVAYRDVLEQTDMTPIEARLGDTDANVRAQAATVVGAKRDAAARTTLETLVVSDTDPFVRRNAAYALGKIGSASSHDALLTASTDKSPIVKNVAKAALASLK